MRDLVCARACMWAEVVCVRVRDFACLQACVCDLGRKCTCVCVFEIVCAGACVRLRVWALLLANFLCLFVWMCLFGRMPM